MEAADWASRIFFFGMSHDALMRVVVAGLAMGRPAMSSEAVTLACTFSVETPACEGSVKVWLRQLRDAGREQAAAALWNTYHARLVGLARKMLGGSRRRSYDAEDVVQEAFEAFFRAAHGGRFPELRDRGGLWRLLAEITRNRVADFVKREMRAKRAGGRVRGESVFENRADCQAHGLEHVAKRVEPPALSSLICAEFLRSLEPDLHEVALLKLEGLTNKEIAARLGRVEKTVERKLKLIRARWLEHAEMAAGLHA